MAKKQIIDSIVKLYSKLGGNLSDVLGTRSNVNFMGTGKSSEPFLDMDLNIEALSAISKSKALDELKSSVGFATADKLNDIQANKLLTNMMKMDEFYNPPAAPANITDLATGTRNLDAEGLGSLRASGDYMTDEGVMASETILPMRNVDIPPPGSRGGPDDIAAPVEQGFEGFERTIRELAKSDPELAAQYKTVLTNKADAPVKRGTAREFLVEALKKENPNDTTFADIVSEVDVKFITEGGGGLGGDPLFLVEKYFGPRIVEALPSGASSEEIAIFTQRVLNNVVDARGLRPTDPNFDKMTATFIDETQTFADGGRAGFFAGGLGRLGKAVGYQAMRKYGIEAEDITNLFKSLATDKSLVGKEKTEYFKMLNQVLKNPDDYPEGIREILTRLGKPIDFEKGGRVGFQGGGMDASQDDFNTPSTTANAPPSMGFGNPPPSGGGGGGNDDKQTTYTPPVEVSIGPEYTPLGPVPRFADLDLATKYGIINLRTDLFDTLKDQELDSELSFTGNVGPVNIDASADLEGNKSLGLGFNKGNFSAGAFTDFEGNEGLGFGYRKTFAKGGLAKILEV